MTSLRETRYVDFILNFSAPKRLNSARETEIRAILLDPRIQTENFTHMLTDVNIMSHLIELDQRVTWEQPQRF